MHSQRLFGRSLCRLAFLRLSFLRPISPFSRLSVFSVSRTCHRIWVIFMLCFSHVSMFSCVLLVSRIFPFPEIGRIYGVRKLLVTLMSLSKLPRHFDEAIKNFLDSLMSDQTLTARHNQFLFSIWTSPVSFSPARRASEFPLRSGLARGLSRDPS